MYFTCMSRTPCHILYLTCVSMYFTCISRTLCHELYVSLSRTLSHVYFYVCLCISQVFRELDVTNFISRVWLCISHTCHEFHFTNSISCVRLCISYEEHKLHVANFMSRTVCPYVTNSLFLCHELYVFKSRTLHHVLYVSISKITLPVSVPLAGGGQICHSIYCPSLLVVQGGEDS